MELAALAGCPPAFLLLEQLSLNHNAIGGEGMASLSLAMGDGALPRLLTLFLIGNPADDAVVQQALSNDAPQQFADPNGSRLRTNLFA